MQSESAVVYQTPGTRQKWGTLLEWMGIVKYHFESMPNGLHRRNPDRNGAIRHLNALLETSLIEQCLDLALIEEIHEFFAVKVHRNNSGLRRPSRENRAASPNGLLCNRLHNQIQRLKSGKGTLRTIDALERAEAEHLRKPGARIEIKDRLGDWRSGTVVRIYEANSMLLIRLDDGSFIQKSWSKLLEQGIKPSRLPVVETIRYGFESGDRVVNVRFKSAPAATVMGVKGNDVTLKFDNGKISTFDAMELRFHFESNHSCPEDYLRYLEKRLTASLSQLEPLLEGQSTTRLEQEQETLIEKAERFAAAHSIKIEGGGESWVFNSIDQTG